MIQKQLVLLALFLSAVLFHTRVEAVALNTETITDDELKTKGIEKVQTDKTIATVPEGNALEEQVPSPPAPRPLPEPHSCKEIKKNNPKSKSGMYYFKVNEKFTTVYCNMDTICSSSDGWARVAYLNMGDSSHSCPIGLHERKSGNIRACGRKPGTTKGNCASTFYFPFNMRYTAVCGRVFGYQFGTPDAVYNGNGYIQNRIDAAYVDGVSITRGYPREHIWTFMGSFSEQRSSHSNCPCATAGKQSLQSFIRNYYYCESGNPDPNKYQFKFYTSDKLWDGINCNYNEVNCCNKGGRPWFHRILSARSDDIEVRVCGDQGTTDEDTPISFIEIYVK